MTDPQPARAATPGHPRSLSQRAAAVAVLVAFATGLVAALALRPPGGAAPAPGDPAGAAAPALRTVHWRVPVAFATNLPALGDNALYVQQALHDSTAGRFHFQPFEPGELVPALSITDAVRERKIQAGYTWLGYDQGKIAVSPLIAAVPFGMEPWEYIAWWYDGGGEAMTQAIYRPLGVEPVLCGLIGPESAGWFREPVTGLADIRGLKIRFAGLGGMVLERLGASVTMLPGGEIFQALEKGAIDATEYSLPVVDQTLGFDRVAKYNLFPGWHQTFTATHLVVNADDWAQLDPADQALVRAVCTAGVTRNLARSEALQGDVLAGYAAKGVTAQALPLDVLRELQRTTEAILDEQAARDGDFARVLASQRDFRARYQAWKQLGYLPRDF